MSVDPDDILLTEGSGQAIHFVTEALVDPGDVVIVDDFVYGGTLWSLSGGVGGSPARPVLGTYVWAKFQFPQPISQVPPTRPKGPLHRNPVALAQEWNRRISTGELSSRAHLARDIGVSRAHVTQVLSLLLLSSEAQDLVLGLGNGACGLGIHALRALLRLPASQQVDRIRELSSINDSDRWLS